MFKCRIQKLVNKFRNETRLRNLKLFIDVNLINPYRFVRNSNNKNDSLLNFINQKPIYNEKNFVPINVKKGKIKDLLLKYLIKGSLVLIDGNVAHKR